MTTHKHKDPPHAEAPASPTPAAADGAADQTLGDLLVSERDKRELAMADRIAAVVGAQLAEALKDGLVAAFNQEFIDDLTEAIADRVGPEPPADGEGESAVVGAPRGHRLQAVAGKKGSEAPKPERVDLSKRKEDGGHVG